MNEKKILNKNIFFLNLVKKEMSNSINIWNVAGALVLGAGLLYVMTAETKIEKLKREGVEAATELTIDHFVKLIKNNPEITLDMAILDFENAKVTSLEDFSKRKHRTVEDYHKAYGEMFKEAKKKIIRAQTDRLNDFKID